MAKESFRSQVLKGVLLIHFIISLVGGIILLSRASWFAITTDWNPFDPVMTHLVGAAIITWGISSLFAYLDPPKNVIVVRLEILFGILAVAALLFSSIFRTNLTPSFAWVFALFTGLFTLLFLVFYPTE